MEPEENENKQTFLQWFSAYKEEREQNNDYWNLARSSSPELETLVLTFEQSMSVIEGRIKSGKTYGLVFDAKKYRDATILDALVKHRICAELSPDEEYLVKSDKHTQMTKLVKRNDRSNQLSKVLVPAANWPLPREARLKISSEDYSTYLNHSQNKCQFVDLIILALNSNKEFQNEEIKMLLKEIKERKYNILMILNNAPSVECTCWEQCDVCYEDIRESLVDLEVPKDDRFIKLSAITILENRDAQNLNNESLEKAVNIIKEELTMDNVIGRYLKGAQLFMNKFDEVKKMVQETKTIVANETSICEKILQEKKIETQKTIDDSKNATECLLEEKIKTKTDKIDNIDLTFVKENIDPIIDKSFEEFRERFKNQIKSMIITGNSNLVSYITEMYFNQYEKESYEINLKKTIEECCVEVLKELKNSDLTGKEVLEKFLLLVKSNVTNTFNLINSSYENYRDNLTNDVVDKFEKFENTITSINGTFIECLKKEMDHQLQQELPIIEEKITETVRSMEGFVTRFTNEIIVEISKNKNKNIYPKRITELLNLPDIAEKISKAIQNQLSNLKSTILSIISNIGSDPQTKAWINNLIVLIETRVFDSSIICTDKLNYFDKLNLESDDLYTFSEEGFIIQTIHRFNYGTGLKNHILINDHLMTIKVKNIENNLKTKLRLMMNNIPTMLRNCIETNSWQE